MSRTMHTVEPIQIWLDFDPPAPRRRTFFVQPSIRWIEFRNRLIDRLGQETWETRGRKDLPTDVIRPKALN